MTPMDDVKPASITETVREYYGRVLKSSADLKTSACCLAEALPRHVAEALKDVHPEVRERFYGCGSPIPPALEDATVLDLGCGSGRDCYVLSKLVGPHGRVIGLDMTDEQLAVARRHQRFHAEAFGWANTDFRQGYIEDLATAGTKALNGALVQESVRFYPAKDVDSAFGKGAVLFEGEGNNYMIHASRREAPGQAEVHLDDADLIHVLDGAATFVTGGDVVDGKSTAADEIRGSSIAGGETRLLAKGDVVIVPAGTPHWFKEVKGPFLYYVVKVR